MHGAPDMACQRGRPRHDHDATLSCSQAAAGLTLYANSRLDMHGAVLPQVARRRQELTRPLPAPSPDTARRRQELTRPLPAPSPDMRLRRRTVRSRPTGPRVPLHACELDRHDARWRACQAVPWSCCIGSNLANRLR